METDIRVQLENELDTLQEDNVESWIARCFEACDPRYDSDWLSGMFELANMQFPDNYEVRAACSRATVLEAQRLAGEGDVKEAIRRLDGLLEADPYCTEGFELLEELSAQLEAASAPAAQAEAPVAPVEAPAVPPEVALEPVTAVEASPEEPAGVADPEPLPEVASVPGGQDEIYSMFADDDQLFAEAAGGVSAEAGVAPPESWEQVADAIAELMPEVSAAPEPPQEVAELASPEPEPEPVVVAEAIPQPIAETVAEVAPPSIVVEPEAVAPPEPASLPSSNGVVASGDAPWDELWGLPRYVPSSHADGNYLQLVAAMAERMRGLGRPDAALRLLVDHREVLQSSPSWGDHVASTLRAWVDQLIAAGQGSAAVQAAHWGSRVLAANGEVQALFGDLVERFGPPTRPALSFAVPSTDWHEALRANPGDAALRSRILNHYGHDSDGMLMLFRQLAVENPQESRHVLNLGWAYFHTGAPALALVHTQRALKLAPSRQGYQLLADIYDRLNQPSLKDSALKSLQETAAP